MSIDYKNFDLEGSTSTGGVTGSKRVTMGDKYYQLKPSILDNQLIRKVKANWNDRENYGEVIASKMTRTMLVTDEFEPVPDVSLVYDRINKKTPIASKYLEGEKVRTLDEYIKEKNPDIKFGHHVKFIDSARGTLGPGEYDISGNDNALLRADIAKGIVASMMCGDHDINPGNFVVISNNNIDRVARIDFGHAFNDLLNAPAQFGGQVRDKDNQILDFLNRENVAGPKFGAISKLWQSYPGLIPSQEMADALKEMSKSTELNAGIKNAREEFYELLSEMRENNDKKGITHLMNSLEAISSNVSGSKLDLIRSTPEENIDKAFEKFEEFAQNNLNNMQDVSQLMELQIKIDQMIKEKVDNKSPTLNQMGEVLAKYSELEKKVGIKHGDTGIKWIKMDPDEPAYKKDLEGYIANRCNKLGLNEKLSKEFVNDITDLDNRSSSLSTDVKRFSEREKDAQTVINKYINDFEAAHQGQPLNQENIKEFMQNVVKCNVDAELITPKQGEAYKNDQLNKDVKNLEQIAIVKDLSMGDFLKNVASVVCTKVGLENLGKHFQNKITPEGKSVIKKAQVENIKTQVKLLREGISAAQPATKPQKDQIKLNSPRKSSGPRQL